MSASRYAIAQDAAASPQDIEIRAFRYVNGLLAAAERGGGENAAVARATALHKTHRLWTILISDLASPGNALPPDLRGRLVSLGLWAQRESLARMSDDRSLEPLMALHRDLLEGLEAQRRPSGAAASAYPAGAMAPASAKPFVPVSA